MKTQKRLSPTKENLSPTKHASIKNPEVVAELLAFIKSSGMKVPSHLDKQLSSENVPLLKLSPTKKQPAESDQVKKLKVKLGDTEFELKKIEEDFAQFKHQARIEREKEIRKWQDSYNQLKSTLENSCEDSSIKLLRLRQSTDKEIASLREKHQAEFKQQIERLTKNYEEKLSSLRKLKEREIAELKDLHCEEIKRMIEKAQRQCRQQKNIHELELKKQALKHKQTIENKEKQFQSIYTALQSEKKTQEKLHEKTKIQSNQAKEKLYSDLYYERNVKKDLQETIANREKDIRSLKSKINDQEVELHLQKERAAKREKEINQNFEKKLIGADQLHREAIVKLESSQDKELRKYQNKIQQLNEWKEHHQTLMKESYEEMEKKFEERPSRKEDLDMIQKLKGRLSRKEEEVRILNKELKNCALEIQNKQETYNKIFTSNTVNKLEKKPLSRERDDFRSRDSLCRKSQTTDIKFLLKVYNKHI